MATTNVVTRIIKTTQKSSATASPAAIKIGRQPKSRSTSATKSPVVIASGHQSNATSRSTPATATATATATAATTTTATATATATATVTQTITLTEDEILSSGLEFVHFPIRRQEKVKRDRNIKRFRGNYGVSPLTVSQLIRDLQTKLDTGVQIKNFKIKYLFLSLHWLKAYPRYVQLEGAWDICPEVIGKYTKEYAKSIQHLKKYKVKWFEEGDIDDDDIFLVSVDGIHCRTYEVRKDPGKKWYSHKSHGAGLAYELAIAVRSDRLVWMNGPYCASRPDITIFRYGDGDETNPGRNLREMIPEGKRAIADSGYKGEDGKTCSITRQSDSDEVKELKARAKSRQEVFNSKVKAFEITATEFRHNINLHGVAFEAVCILLQYEMENGCGLFEV